MAHFIHPSIHPSVPHHCSSNSRGCRRCCGRSRLSWGEGGVRPCANHQFIYGDKVSRNTWIEKWNLALFPATGINFSQPTGVALLLLSTYHPDNHSNVTEYQKWALMVMYQFSQVSEPLTFSVLFFVFFSSLGRETLQEKKRKKNAKKTKKSLRPCPPSVSVWKFSRQICFDDWLDIVSSIWMSSSFFKKS